MENQFIFRLKRPIVIPISQYDQQGVIVYNSRDFAFGYSVVPNPKEKQLNVSLLVYRVSDETLIRTLTTFNITEQGFPTGVVLNALEIKAQQEAIEKYQDTINTLEGTLSILYLQEAALASAGESTVEVAAQILDLYTQKQEAATKLSKVVIPEPELEYINRYSDVIDYFDKDGSITVAGIEWAKSVPFLGLTLNDYLA
jgi:hypothetical protein